MSQVVQLTDSWPGFPAIRKLVVFGDSYSSLSDFGELPEPSATNPLGTADGVTWPGFTWAERGKANWIGHLISTFAPSVKFDPVKGEAVDSKGNATDKPPILVYGYAVGGDTVTGVERQYERRFLEYYKRKAKEMDLQPKSTLFSRTVTWVGINDCARLSPDGSEASQAVEKLFAIQQRLYDEIGARNILLINVPCIERSPAIPRQHAAEWGQPYNKWNEAVEKQAAAFSQTNRDATIMIFSSHATFSSILDEPDAYGFSEADVRKRAGEVWVDHLHPTSKVHEWVARDLGQFLGSVDPLKE